MASTKPERLRDARKRAGYGTAISAIQAFGFGEASYRHHENGTRDFDPDSARRYARAFKVKPGWLLGLENDAGVQDTEIPVIGYVGAGAAIYPIDDGGGGFDYVERPPFVQGEAVSVEVRGDSLIPVAEDGWRLVYAGEQALLEDEVLNRLCVVALTDGRMLVKRIVKGSEPLRYHLLSTNAPMIENVEVLWAARVKAIIPR